MNQPTHYLALHFGLIHLHYQPSLVVDSGEHPSRHVNCHHQITYCKLNLKTQYPPPYQLLVWNIENPNITSIRKAIHTVNWEILFSNKIVHEQVSIFNNTLMNIFSNYIPKKFATIHDKDLPWMTERIKNKITKKKLHL